MKSLKRILCLALCLMIAFASAEEAVGSLLEQAQALIAASDDQGAAELLRKAAETGDATAQCALGECYAEGIGVEQDLQKAIAYYTLSAEQGFAPAQAILGLAYLSGAGVEENPETALKYLQLAADQGLPEAQNQLGQCFQFGIGVDVNLEEAAKYYLPAAEQGLADAQYNIGRHENGKRQKNEIGIHSLRMGNEVGTHEVIFALGSQVITIKHEAENRALFAEGALAAAAFLCGRAPGLYNMDDIFDE